MLDCPFRALLYVATWKNPEPKRKGISIDFGSTSYTGTNPFRVAK
jgi:hypothetical protein